MTTIRYSEIQISGNDAFNFLQGQLTNDLGALDAKAEQLSGYCTPKGRLLALFRVTKIDSGFLLRCPTEIAESVAARLKMFVLRADVHISCAEKGAEQSVAALIEAGQPEILTATQESFIPQMVNLDLIDGMSFTKGCYPGQEITARMKYRGEVKRRMLRLTGNNLNAAVGDKLDNGVGQVVLATPNELLAVMRLDSVDDVPTIGSSTLVPTPLPYNVK